MSRLLREFGIFRILLMLSALLMIIGGAMAAGVNHHFDWDQMPLVFVPVFTPIVFTVILLDITMSKLRMEDTVDVAEQSRFRQINKVYKVLLVALILSWTPFIWSIAQKQL